MTNRLKGPDLTTAIQDPRTLLLDVRNPEEIRAHGTVEGSLNIPKDEIESRLDAVPRDRPILTA